MAPRRKRKQRGGAAVSTAQVKDALSRLHQVARDTGIVSNALGAFGHQTASQYASSLGYGKRRKRRTGQRGGFLNQIGRLISVPLAGVMGASGGLIQGLQGLGKGKRQMGMGPVSGISYMGGMYPRSNRIGTA